ncbi:MAG: GTPase ObgE [Aestuariivita sp.]|nr:GTPase ObgE [Aestuariivita sp.]
MKFLDFAKIYVRSGNGGAGCVSFRREKYIEFGGPDGGNGGKGGSVRVTAVSGLNTLIDFRYQQHYFAKNGQPGRGKQKTGRRGDDIILRVPVGTEILAEDQETLIADLVSVNDEVEILKGGNGGFGNLHFKTSRNQSPRHSNPGQSGIERTIWLRLKLIADSGIIGLPNAGKSTLLAAITNALPKVASYPFTTLHPNLGVIQVQDSEFVLADIPGLIAGAHQGQGIGDRFLGHVERCAVLLHLLDGTSTTIVEDYKTVLSELSAYSRKLAKKPFLVAINKIDLMTSKECSKTQQELEKVSNKQVYLLSGVSGQGIQSVMCALKLEIEKKKNRILQEKVVEPWHP